MKIGILTFHRAINYGAILQCYALSETLKDLGHDVWIVDYRPSSIEKYRHPFQTSKACRSLKERFKTAIGTFLMSFSRIIVISNFDSFLRKHFKFTSSFSEVGNFILDGFDVLIFGSDQIWSPSICNGFDDVFWGNFPHNGVKMITYAASIGGHNKLDIEDLERMKHLLQGYDSISVREVALQELVSNLGVKNVSLVCDPTFLAPKEIFDKLAVKPNIDDYVLYFALEEDLKYLRIAKDIARMNNKKLVWLQTYKGLRKYHDVHTVGSVSVAVFLGLFKYASKVVCISFHATAFSIIFHKDFYVIETAQADRARNLLEEVGLGERLVKSIADLPQVDINYESVDKKIRAIASVSKSYLAKSLDEK